MYAQDAAELFPSDDDEESITLNPEEGKAVRKRLEKAHELEKENRELREKLRRAQDELRRTKTPLPRRQRPHRRGRRHPLLPSVLPSSHSPSRASTHRCPPSS